jgi:TolB-like protein
MSDVFVSYKRENLAAVGRLVEGLRAEGLGVWWDQDIAPNAAWEATIEQQLEVAKLVIVAWSPAAVASENVKAEARWARQQGRLLQVFVESCEPPLFFGERQGVDLKHWSGAASDAAFRSVLEAVRKGLVRAAISGSDEPAPPPLIAAGDLPALPTKPSIVVLPFANLSGDPEQDYFADGMVVEIVEALSRIKSIFVIAGGSSLSFKGKGVSPQDAARQLGVRYVLEGSVRKAGTRVRIGVQLIDATDGAQIWTNRFEDTLDDVFALQDKVALAVAGKIEPTVQQAEVRRVSARPTDNMGSYDLYLRALRPNRSSTKAGSLEALDLLNRAIDLDPDFGPALGVAGYCHMIINTWGWSDDPESHRRQAIEMAHRALKAAGDDAYVLAYAAQVVATLDGDLDAGLALIKRAIGVNPGSSVAWFVSSSMRLRTGETELAIEHIENAMRLDPMGPNRAAQIAFIGMARFKQARFTEALALLKDAAQQTDLPGVPAYLAATYGHLGLRDEALEALTRYRRLSQVPIDVFARSLSRQPAQLKLFLDGIALAEGKPRPDGAGNPAS